MVFVLLSIIQIICEQNCVVLDKTCLSHNINFVMPSNGITETLKESLINEGWGTNLGFLCYVVHDGPLKLTICKAWAIISATLSTEATEAAPKTSRN